MRNASVTAAGAIAEARVRIAGLLLEIDDIVLQVNPQIEAEYATKIGYLENDLRRHFDLEGTPIRLKFKKKD